MLTGCSFSSSGLIPLPSSRRCAVRYDARPFGECVTWDWQRRHGNPDRRYVIHWMMLLLLHGTELQAGGETDGWLIQGHLTGCRFMSAQTSAVGKCNDKRASRD